MKRIELTGQKFGKLTVTGYAGANQWSVRCDCGTEKTVAGAALRGGHTKSCGCAQREWCSSSLARIKRSDTGRRIGLQVDHTGKRFGKLMVIGRAEPEIKGACRVYSMWNVRCDCGVEKVIRGVYLSSGSSQSCGCGQIHKLPEGEAPRNQTLARYQHQAKSRGLTWELQDAEAFSLFQGDCHYCGRSPESRVYLTRTELNSGFTYNGIDRKNNEIGYLPGNVVSCCVTCNRAKNKMSYEEFLAYLHRVSTFWSGSDLREGSR